MSWKKAMKVKVKELLIMTRLRHIFIIKNRHDNVYCLATKWVKGSFYICATSALPSMPFTVAIKECQPSLWFSNKRKK